MILGKPIVYLQQILKLRIKYKSIIASLLHNERNKDYFSSIHQSVCKCVRYAQVQSFSFLFRRLLQHKLCIFQIVIILVYSKIFH